MGSSRRCTSQFLAKLKTCHRNVKKLPNAKSRPVPRRCFQGRSRFYRDTQLKFLEHIHCIVRNSRRSYPYISLVNLIFYSSGGSIPKPYTPQPRETGVHVKHQQLLTITALTIALLSACGTTQPTLIQAPQGLTTGFQTQPSENGRFGARAITNLLQETSLIAWGKKANVTLTDLNGFTKVGITDTATGWTSRVVPNSSAGDTYTATLEVKGTGTVQLFLQKGGGDFAQYTNKNITLTGTTTTVTITTVKPADGLALQVGMTNITTGNNLEARNLVVTKGVADTGGGTATPVTVAALSSWTKGAGVTVVDNGDTFQKITTTNASYVNTPVDVIAGQTYRYTATLKGTGTINLFWQQRNSPYTQYATKAVTLTGTEQIITFDTIIPSDGTPAQIGIGAINTTETVYVKNIKVENVNATTGLTGNFALNDPIKPVYSSAISAQISPQSIIVQPLGVGTSADPFPGFSQVTGLVSSVQDFPQWGAGAKVVNATVPYGAAENDTVPWHLRGASTGITNPSLQIEANIDYLFDFSMQIPSESASQKLTLYPQQYYGTPPNRQIAGLCVCGGSGFSFYTAIQADGVYLYVLPPLGPVDANGYSTDTSVRLKLSNGTTIPFDQKLRFQVFYTPSNSGKIVATLVGQQTKTYTGATLTTGAHAVRLYNRARPDMLATGQSSTVYLGGLGVFGITPGTGSTTVFQTNYQALTDGRLIEDLGPDARIKGDMRIDQGFYVSQFDMQAKAQPTRRGGASQPRITTAFGLKAVSFNSANGDKWTNSSGSSFKDYPRSEVDGGDYEYRTLKFARNYELTGWMAFPSDPTDVADDAPNGNTYQIGFQFHSKAHRGSSPVQMVMRKADGWTFMMAPNFFQDPNCTVNSVELSLEVLR
jgi:hypothetical protein